MSGIMWQWLAEHKQDILDYFSTIMREASEIQLVKSVNPQLDEIMK